MFRKITFNLKYFLSQSKNTSKVFQVPDICSRLEFSHELIGEIFSRPVDQLDSDSGQMGRSHFNSVIPG